MVDEVKQADEMPEPEPGEEKLPDDEEPEAEEETADLESQVAQRAEELAGANTRLEELEESISGKDAEIAALRQDKGELEDRLTALNQALSEAISGYKSMIVRSNPEIVEELISGDSIDAINESLDRARALVSKVRQGVEEEILLSRVPAGAPERTPQDLSALSAHEKIQYAIGGYSS